MPAPITIFSVDAIRGRIILNTLRFNGLDAVLQNRIIHVKEIIRKNTPSIVILDTKDLSPNELDLFKSSYTLLSNTPLIVLANRSEIDTLELNDMRVELFKTDPLDAELIISTVNALLEQKRDSGEVIKTEEQALGETANNESGDDSESLEDDLKKFLDLE